MSVREIYKRAHNEYSYCLLNLSNSLYARLLRVSLVKVTIPT